MSTCNVSGCELNKFDGHEECVLHCEKNINGDKDELHIEFYRQLARHIASLFMEETSVRMNLDPRPGSPDSKIICTEILTEGERYNQYKDKEQYLKKENITIDGIRFPNGSGNVNLNYNYKMLLRKVGGVIFYNCELSEELLPIHNFGHHFKKCLFKNKIDIKRVSLLRNERDVLFDECTFDDAVFVRNSGEKANIGISLFSDCIFNSILELKNIYSRAPLFKDTSARPLKAHAIKVIDSEISSRFVVNRYDVGEFELENVEFKEKVELKRSRVKTFKQYNVNYNGLADYHGSAFDEFYASRCAYMDMAIFEKSEFGKSSAPDDSNAAEFRYISFEKSVVFRDAKFYGGLDFSRANYEKAPNFLNSYVSFKNSNRETFRIIKNSFDNVGNFIEANKAFSNEMKKYREELKGKKISQEKIVFYFNKIISDFGQNYWRPIYILLISAVVFAFIYDGYERNVLYEIYEPFNGDIASIVGLFNGFAKGVVPLAKFMVKGVEFLSLLFYVMNIALIWQAVVAIKRHTKR